jgi:hypothetical protein
MGCFPDCGEWRAGNGGLPLSLALAVVPDILVRLLQLGIVMIRVLGNFELGCVRSYR